MCSCPLCPHSAISWAAAAHSEQHTMSLSSPTLTFPFAVVGFFFLFLPHFALCCLVLLSHSSLPEWRCPPGHSCHPSGTYLESLRGRGCKQASASHIPERNGVTPTQPTEQRRAAPMGECTSCFPSPRGTQLMPSLFLPHRNARAVSNRRAIPPPETAAEIASRPSFGVKERKSKKKPTKIPQRELGLGWVFFFLVSFS